jgi:predicted amidohydrolase
VKTKIACLQMASRPYDREYNIRKAGGMVREAAGRGAELCLLPELFVPGYSLTDENYRHAETMQGPTVSALAELAAGLGVHVSGSIIEKDAGDYYNTMFIVGPEGLCRPVHRKVHVASIESLYWKRGRQGTIVKTALGDIGLGICNDLRYPDLWRDYAGKVDLVLLCAAWPELLGGLNIRWAVNEVRMFKEMPVKISRVLEVPLACSNACHAYAGELPLGLGKGRSMGFSKIVDRGEVVASIDSRDEAVIQAELEIATARPPVDPSRFEQWIRYSFSEVFINLFVEHLAPYYCRIPYEWNRRRYSGRD